jgi:hypothetical protein
MRCESLRLSHAVAAPRQPAKRKLVTVDAKELSRHASTCRRSHQLGIRTVLSYDLPVWPKRIPSGHRQKPLENIQKTGLQQNRIPQGFRPWPENADPCRFVCSYLHSRSNDDYVFRTTRYIQARKFVPCWNDAKPLSALRYASCTRSSASSRLCVSQ